MSKECLVYAFPQMNRFCFTLLTNTNIVHRQLEEKTRIFTFIDLGKKERRSYQEGIILDVIIRSIFKSAPERNRFQSVFAFFQYLLLLYYGLSFLNFILTRRCSHVIQLPI